MRLRTFSAPSMAEAIRLARAELGPEAVILATEKLGKSIKLTAALEPAEPLSTVKNKGYGVIAADRLTEIVARALSAHGVPENLIERISAIIDGLPADDPRQALNAALRARFDFSSVTSVTMKRPIILVGPPGAGKTSCAAKLAAMAGVKGHAAILVTCDVAKAGAVEQLAIYARALKIAAYRARNPAALRRAIDRADQGELIVIDSVGSNPFAISERIALQELAEAADAEPILVQACGGDPEETAELAQCYAEIGVRRLIATRLDASRRLGGILSAADRGHLALAEFSISPEIATGLLPAEATFLSSRLLPREAQRQDRQQNANTGTRP